MAYKPPHLTICQQFKNARGKDSTIQFSSAIQVSYGRTEEYSWENQQTKLKIQNSSEPSHTEVYPCPHQMSQEETQSINILMCDSKYRRVKQKLGITE